MYNKTDLNYFSDSSETSDFIRIFFEYQKKLNDKLSAFGSPFSDFGFIILQDRKLYGFGENFFGQLGLNDKICKKQLTLVPFFSPRENRVKKIVCGFTHSIWITYSKKIYSSGRNHYGQLSVGDFKNRKIPCSVLVLFKKKIVEIVDIFAGGYHSVFLSKYGDAFSAGYNTLGQTGCGKRRQRIATPIKVPIPEKILGVSCGGFYSFFITVDGKIYSSGKLTTELFNYNHYSFNSRLLKRFDQPIQLKFFNKSRHGRIIQIVSGIGHSFFLSDNGKVYGIGKNNHGQLGIGNFETQLYPKEVTFKNCAKIISVKCGGNYTVFNTEDDRFLSGFNFFGQLGFENKTSLDSAISPIPFPKKGLNTRIIQSLILFHTSLYFTKNEVFGCGSNKFGQLMNENGEEKVFQILKIASLKVKPNSNALNWGKINESKERIDFIFDTLNHVEKEICIQYNMT